MRIAYPRWVEDKNAATTVVGRFTCCFSSFQRPMHYERLAFRIQAFCGNSLERFFERAIKEQHKFAGRAVFKKWKSSYADRSENVILA